jgi:hypothetical protein
MKTIEAIYKAIKKINPTATASMSGKDINTLVWENGTTPINKKDILDLVPECLAEIEAEEQNKINKKQSAIAKLKALGLDEEEVKAIIGI